MLRRVLKAAAAVAGLVGAYAASVGVVAFGKWAQQQEGILYESLSGGLLLWIAAVLVGGMAYGMSKTFPRYE